MHKLIFILLISIFYGNQNLNKNSNQYFRENEKLLGELVVFSDLKFNLPINIEKVHSAEVNKTLNKIDHSKNNFFTIDSINVYTNEPNTLGLSIGNISLKENQSIDSESYKNNLMDFFKTENVFKSKFLLNEINVIQYQINRNDLMELKLFLITNDRIFLLDFIIDSKSFNDSIEFIESFLSTVRIIN